MAFAWCLYNADTIYCVGRWEHAVIVLVPVNQDMILMGGVVWSVLLERPSPVAIW